MITLPHAVRALFDGPNYAHLATVLPDGSPHSVPVWVGLEDDRITFLTHPQSRKTRNVTRDPRVALAVTDRNQPNVMAQVRGCVTARIEGETAWTIIDRMSNIYLGQPYPLRQDRVVFLVEPEYALAQTFG
jgi:PPOX class probable F420-dependent enzyme